MSNKEKEIQMMTDWYNRSYVLYEMLYCGLFDREVAFMKPKHHREKNKQTMYRYMKVFKPHGFTYALNSIIDFKGNNLVLNVYSSISKYENGIPDFGNNIYMRKKDTDEWNARRHEDFSSYDVFIDVDAPNFGFVKEAKQDVMKIMKLLDSFSMPYYLRFSGCGYHIIIPYTYMKDLGLHFDPHLVNGRSVYEVFDAISEWLCNNITELVDTGLHDCVRVSKVPYSLTFYPEGVFVCWPFKTKQEFYLHTPGDYKLNAALGFAGEQKIYRRGQTLFNKDLWNPSCTVKFLEALKIEVEKDAVVGVE